MTSQPRLSLCMIVRDEQEMLPGLLDSVHGLWDEFLVADTGSTDGTVDLLEKAGAIVKSFAWCNDFAAARNAGLDMASGEWILFLDADERVSPELATSIRALLNDDEAGAATVLLRDDLPHGHIRESRLLRLFRRDPDIRFEHAIHEDPGAGVRRYLARTGRILCALDGPLHHLGYARDVTVARDKRTRDLALLSDCVDRDPRDWYSRYKMLEQARYWNDAELWRETAETTAAVMDAAGDGTLTGFHFLGDLLTLISQGLHDDPLRELAWLENWYDAAQDLPEYRLRRGILLEATGDPTTAANEYEACLDLPSDLLVQNVTVRPLLGLCRLAAAAGDTEGALHLAERALEHNPRDPEGMLAAVSFAETAGSLLDFVDRHRERHGDDAALDLARAALACGALEASRAMADRLVSDLPEAALGVLVCDLIAGCDLDLTIDMERNEADAALETWLSILWGSRQIDLMLAFADHAESVTGAFPWLPAWLERETAVLAHA